MEYRSTSVNKSPKTDLRLWNDKVVAFVTDADLVSEKRDAPSSLIVLDTKTGTQILSAELRGSNFFPQLIFKDNIFVALSTGDIISLDLNKGKLTVIDQHPEPFLSSTFRKNDQNCAISVMGRVFCYRGKKKVFTKNLGDHVIGGIDSLSNDVIYVPTRAGYQTF